MNRKRIKQTLTILTLTVALSACGHKHEWKDATCEEPKVCISCGKTEGESKGHNWIAATTSKPKTCKICGKMEGRVSSLYERVGGELYIGDEFVLGTYEQDNNLDNGAEDIEWIVYEKTDDNVYLCISKYVLDAQIFGYDELEIRNRWSTSYLREWLNKDFYNTAFTDYEAKNLVEMSTNYYTWNSINDSDMRKDTAYDMVRVLNFGELDEFPGCVKITDYAKAQGAPCINDGTREHDDCSDGWYMMSYNTHDVREYVIPNISRAGSMGISGYRGNALTVAIYTHKYNNNSSKSEMYKEYESIEEGRYNKYIEGVRPVIKIELVDR